MLLGEQHVEGGPFGAVGVHIVSEPQHWFPPQATCPGEQQMETWPLLPRLRHVSPVSQQSPMGVRMFLAPPQSTGQHAVPALWQSRSQLNMSRVHSTVSTITVQMRSPRKPNTLPITLQTTVCLASAAHRSSFP